MSNYNNQKQQQQEEEQPIWWFQARCGEQALVPASQYKDRVRRSTATGARFLRCTKCKPDDPNETEKWCPVINEGRAPSMKIRRKRWQGMFLENE
jgi:hypothetical protein